MGERGNLVIYANSFLVHAYAALITLETIAPTIQG